MKVSKFVRLLIRSDLFLVLLVSFVLVLSCMGYTQQEVSVIRHPNSKLPLLDPAIGTNYMDSTANCNLYDSLVFPNPDGSVKPWLGKSWEMSEDGLTYIFELVPGVKFHNGDELTADDIVFSMQRAITIGEGYSYLFIPSIKEVKALEKYKVQFTLKKTFGPFLGALVRFYIVNEKQVMSNIKKEGSYGEFGDYGRSWLVNHDAGSGPYMVTEVKPAEFIMMEKFNDYWAGWENKDAPQCIKEFAPSEPITVKTLMAGGELEVTNIFQPQENLKTLDRLPNVDIGSFYEGSVLNLMLNTKKPPTDDIHFRKALSYCVDYKIVIDKIWPRSMAVTGPVAFSTPGYNPNLEPLVLDLAKAKKELKESPYYGKLDQYPVEIAFLGAIPDEEKIALMIQSNAAKIGIKVSVLKKPSMALAASMATVESTSNGTFYFVAPHYSEAGSMLMSRYHSSSCGTWEQGEWLQDPEIDTMIEDAIATLDQKERFKKYYAIQEKIKEICPSIWLMEIPTEMNFRSDYVVVPAVELFKQGKPCTLVMGYSHYFRDYKVTPEIAQPPYVPFKNIYSKE